MAALRDVFFAVEMIPGHNGAIHDNAVVIVEGVFHTDPDDAIGMIYVGIEDKGSECNESDEAN